MPAPRFHPFVRLIFCGIGLVAVQFLLVLLVMVASALSTPWTNRDAAAQLLDLTTRLALPLLVLSYPASLGWMWLCRRKFDNRSFVSLGLRPRRAGADMARGIATGTLAITLLWLVLWLTGTISVAGWSQVALKHGVGLSIAFLLGYALVFFAVGFFEETLFRGYTLHNLNAWLGWRGAVAAQAILFALVHLGNVVGASDEARRAAIGGLPSLFLIAVFFALSVRKTGSLWFPIGFHFAWNFCLGCVFSLSVSGVQTFRLLDVKPNENSWLSGGSFGAEGSFYLIPILIALIYYISRAPDHPQALLDLELLNRRDAVAIAPLATQMEDEMPDEERESRYRTKFGTSQGFSADTLRELRDLQEAREKSQREAADATRREALASLNVAPPAETKTETNFQSETVSIAPEAATIKIRLDSTKNEARAIPGVQNAPEIVVAPEIAVTIPETVTTPEIVAPPVRTPPATDPAVPIKKKPPSPRW